MTDSQPGDAELLAAGGWDQIGSAGVLAKACDGNFCAVLINTQGGDTSGIYSTIVECFTRGVNGVWLSLGHSGAGRDEGSGEYAGYGRYEYSWVDGTGWTVVAVAQVR